MNSKTTAYVFLAFIAILLWNSFLIQRDKKMFNTYDKVLGIGRLKQPPSNSLKSWCGRQKGQQPDCIN